jgi:hypothetical protein
MHRFKDITIKESTWFLFGSTIILFLYNLTFFRSYLPLSEGWFQYLAMLMKNGAVPYQDFHLFLFPLYIAQLDLITDLIGLNFFNLRVLGLILALIINAILFTLYRHIMRAPIAAIMAFFATIYYQSIVVYIGYDFLDFYILYGLVSTALLINLFVRYEQLSCRAKLFYSFIAAFFSCLSLLIKQSNGSMVCVCLTISLVLVLSATRDDIRTKVKIFTAWGVGGVTPAILTVLWLIQSGNFDIFITNTLQGGSASKGGWVAIFFMWVPRLISDYNWIYISWVLLLFKALSYVKVDNYLKLNNRTITLDSVIISLMVSTIVTMTFYVPYINQNIAQILVSLPQLGNLYRHEIPIVFVFNLILGVVYIYKMYKNKGSYFEKIIVILSSSSLAFFLGTGTSGALSAAGSFILIGALIGIPLNYGLDNKSNAWQKLGALLIFAVVISEIAFMSARKYQTPYTWWGLVQPPVWTAKSEVNHELLKGMKVSFQDKEMIESVLGDIEQYTEADEKVYVFPHMSIFNLLSNRQTPTFSKVHWFDVAPNKVVLEDIKILKKFKPKMILYLDMPRNVWDSHERAFRNDKFLAQRKIKDLVYAYIKKDQYRVLRTFNVNSNNRLLVLVRND